MPASAVHHTATTDESWDGPDAVAAMPNDKAVLTYCHAWHTTDADDAKSGYKFPHHKTKGGPANLAACRNGLARLDGADIPEGDKAGVKKHLQAHLDDGAANRARALGLMSNDERSRAGIVRVRGAAARSDSWFALDQGSDDAASLSIYDEIGFWGVTASDFQRQLAAITAATINVSINSPGGDVFDGIAIASLLRAHAATVNVVVDGLAASAASIVAMAGDSVVMMPQAMLMIHDAWSSCVGNADEMRATAELLDAISNNIATSYAERSGGDAGEWRDVMRAEKWYNAQEAVDAGLADSVFSGAGQPQHQNRAVPAVMTYNRPAAPAEPEFNPDSLRSALKGLIP